MHHIYNPMPKTAPATTTPIKLPAPTFVAAPVNSDGGPEAAAEALASSDVVGEAEEVGDAVEEEAEVTGAEEPAAVEAGAVALGMLRVTLADAQSEMAN